MAIAGLKTPTPVIEDAELPLSRVGEAVNVTVNLLERLGLVDDETALRESLSSDYERLTALGDGRLYLELSATVTTNQLIQLANGLATESGHDQAYLWPNFWVPGTEEGSVTEAELNGSATSFTARLALFDPDASYDPLLHFTNSSFDDKYRDSKKQATQLDLIERVTAEFTTAHAGAMLRAADERDFLVWYIMDLIRGVSAENIVLARGYMLVPRHGRRTVDGDSCVGSVDSSGGRAEFGWDFGGALGCGGVGLSAGFLED